MRGATSVTITALRRFSEVMRGVNAAGAFVSPEAREPGSEIAPTISRSIAATPLIEPLDSGELALNETSSAQVFCSGKRRVSSSLKVRRSRSTSAFSIISATSPT